MKSQKINLTSEAPDMNMELKGIKYYAARSQGTHCYSAILYVNGKPVAIVDNDGVGGCDSVDPHPKCELVAYKRIMGEVSAYMNSQLHSDGFGQTLENWCHEMVNSFLAERETKKCLKVVSFVKPDGKIYEFKGLTATPENIAAVKRSHGWDAANIVLNELPFSEAVKYVFK